MPRKLQPASTSSSMQTMHGSMRQDRGGFVESGGNESSDSDDAVEEFTKQFMSTTQNKSKMSEPWTRNTVGDDGESDDETNTKSDEDASDSTDDSDDNADSGSDEEDEIDEENTGDSERDNSDSGSDSISESQTFESNKKKRKPQTVVAKKQSQGDVDKKSKHKPEQIAADIQGKVVSKSKLKQSMREKSTSSGKNDLHKSSSDEESQSDTEVSGSESEISKSSDGSVADSTTADSEREIDGDEKLVKRQDVKNKNKSDQSESGSEADSDDEEVDETALDNEFKKLRQELANLPFNELQELKEKIGIKAYNRAMFGENANEGFDGPRKKKFTRENKNRPAEMTSKRPVSVFREVVQIKKKMHRDPRFDDLSGKFDDKVFRQTYSFVDGIKEREREKLITQYQREKNTDKKKQIQELVHRMNQQSKADQEKRMRETKDLERRKQEVEQIKQGKRPFHLKKSDKRKLELAEKFRDLEKSGKVDKYLARKRKKTAAKDRKHLPNKRFAPS